MRPQLESMLDDLSGKFAERKVKGRPVVINPRKFIEAVAEGKTLGEAAKEAGSKASNEKSLQVTGSKLLQAHPEYRAAITEMIEEKQRLILGAMTQEKIESASLSSQAMAFGILTDKGELLAGRPTQRHVTDVNLESLEKQQLLGFILGRLSGSGDKRLT